MSDNLVLHSHRLTLVHRLYVGSLHFNLTESDIKQVFEPFGELDFVDLHRDPVTGRSKGYAFVQSVYLFPFINGSLTCLTGTRRQRMPKWLWNRWKGSNWPAAL